MNVEWVVRMGVVFWSDELACSVIFARYVEWGVRMGVVFHGDEFACSVIFARYVKIKTKQNKVILAISFFITVSGKYWY